MADEVIPWQDRDDAKRFLEEIFGEDFLDPHNWIEVGAILQSGRFKVLAWDASNDDEVAKLAEAILLRKPSLPSKALLKALEDLAAEGWLFVEPG